MTLPDKNNSSSFKFDEQHAFIDKWSCTNISQIVPEKDPCDKNDSILHPTLDYINRILLEEDIDEQFSGYQEVAALSDIEKPFYDIIGEKYPPLPNNQLAFSQPNTNHFLSTSISDDPIISNSISTSLTQDSRIESSLTKEFQRGVEEGMKFLPTIHNLAVDLQVSSLSLNMTHKRNDKPTETELKEDNVHGSERCKAKGSSTDADLNILEERNSKMPVLYTEETIRDEMFDKVLLDHGEEYAREEISRLQEIMKFEANHQFTKKEDKKDNVDLESLLIQCSEAVARNDRKIAEELIKEIRKQASPFGNGAQRFACILTDGLEARLASTGSESYHRLVDRRISAREVLKAYHMYMTASPLLRVAYYFANEYICKVAENASKIHIIDLGITFGFQWPPLIQALAKRKGSAPKLRITGIDRPEPGFRPAERIKQIGVRLEEYAKSFGVPFEYQCIASLWECISIDDLKIDDDEVLIVNSMIRFKQVKDDTFPNSPRDKVLNLIRQIKPKVLILGILNASFGPFFTTRFRKVILYYSTFFEMLDVLVPRDDEGRQLLERELLAPVIINLVACEGPNRVERPETYKQWHKRISQAGFEQLAMDRNIVKDCNAKVKSSYHEGFFIEEESGWLLQGWKGRIYYGLSVWEPKVDSSVD
jgi:GRAS domain family